MYSSRKTDTHTAEELQEQSWELLQPGKFIFRSFLSLYAFHTQAALIIERKAEESLGGNHAWHVAPGARPRESQRELSVTMRNQTLVINSEVWTACISSFIQHDINKRQCRRLGRF